MKIRILIVLLSINSALSHAQGGPLIIGTLFKGRIELDSLIKSAATISFVQDSIIKSVDSDSNGIYSICAKLDYSKPFSVHFKCEGCLEKLVLIDVSNMNITNVYDMDTNLLMERCDMSMISRRPNHPMEMLQVARFNWNQFLRLDQGHSEIQKIRLEIYMNNFDSTRVEYYENNQLKKSIPIINGQLHGKVILYNENGSKVKEICMNNDQLEGEFILYNDDVKYL
jgi:hypothetical protein